MSTQLANLILSVTFGLLLTACSYLLPEKPAECVDVFIPQNTSKKTKAELIKIRSKLVKKPTDQLIDSFYACDLLEVFAPQSTHEYAIMLYTNKIIEDELRRRGNSDRAVIELYQNSEKQIFTGSDGPYKTIGFLCKEILEN